MNLIPQGLLGGASLVTLAKHFLAAWAAVVANPWLRFHRIFQSREMSVHWHTASTYPRPVPSSWRQCVLVLTNWNLSSKWNKKEHTSKSTSSFRGLKQCLNLTYCHIFWSSNRPVESVDWQQN